MLTRKGLLGLFSSAHVQPFRKAGKTKKTQKLLCTVALLATFGGVGVSVPVAFAGPGGGQGPNGNGPPGQQAGGPPGLQPGGPPGHQGGGPPGQQPGGPPGQQSGGPPGQQGGKDTGKDYSNSSIVTKMMAFNSKKDGKLTKEEVTDPRLHRLFDQADTNQQSITVQ